MAKTIRLSHEGNTYTLEYTRATVGAMERSGFKANELLDKPMIMLPALFAGAFRAHHPYLNKKVIDEIYDRMDNRQELIAKLSEMYNEPFEALLGDAEVEEAKKVSWEADW